MEQVQTLGVYLAQIQRQLGQLQRQILPETLEQPLVQSGLEVRNARAVNWKNSVKHSAQNSDEAKKYIIANYGRVTKQSSSRAIVYGEGNCAVLDKKGKKVRQWMTFICRSHHCCEFQVWIFFLFLSSNRDFLFWNAAISGQLQPKLQFFKYYSISLKNADPVCVQWG